MPLGSIARRLAVSRRLSPSTLRVFSLSRQTVNHLRDVVSRHDEACLMFKKTNWTARARRFLNRNWKFLVQTGVTILGILHR
jgi:hypothetical protein